jgi:hypothetical protein
MPVEEKAVEEAAQKKEDSLNAFDLEKQFPEFKGWEAIGFHRPLGQELWQVIIEQINNALWVFIALYLIPFIRPFPEIDGINGIADGLYAIFYVIFDTGTNFGITRFIAEYRIKDPKRMCMYVSFEIRYQMITGLIQVTLLSWYTLQIVEYGNYAYLAWILLIMLQKQWPGMLGSFKTLLSGMQHHAKVEVMNLFQGQIVERITLIGFVLYGRWWGETNPAIGIIMGICIFTHLGNYIDDVVFAFISGYYANKILKQFVGLSLRDVFQIKIRRDVYREMILYGVQGSLLPILWTFINTFTLLKYTSTIPGYVAYSALIGFGGTFSSIIGQFGDLGLYTSVAESYSNGKIKLAEFYTSYSLRWRYFFYILIGMALFAVIPFFLYIIAIPNGPLQYYKGATVFFVPLLIRKLFDPLFGLPGPIIGGAQHITAGNIISAIHAVLSLVFVILWIDVIKVQDTWGDFGVLFLIGFNGIVPLVITIIIQYVYVNKRILKIKIYLKATFLGPAIAASPVLLITTFWYNTAFVPMTEAIGIEFTIVISMLLLFLILILIYFPLNIIVGGWDDYMFFTFKKAIDLSGPSKPIFLMLFKVMEKFRKASIKLGTWDRKGWSIPYKEAHKEIIELMEIKRLSLIKNKSN